LKTLTLAPAPDKEAYRKAVLNTCLSKFLQATNEVKLQVLTIFDCAAFATLPQETIIEFFKSVGLEKFYNLTAEQQDQIFQLLG